MDPINQYSNNSPAFDVSLSANVKDRTLSESSQNSKIFSLSKKRLCSEINNEHPSHSKALKKPKLDQSSGVSFFDPNNTLLKTCPHLQTMRDPFAIKTIIVPGPNGQKHCFPIRGRSLEKISPVYERKSASDSWNDGICLWEKDTKDNEDSYYHLEAASQVVLFAYRQTED